MNDRILHYSFSKGLLNIDTVLDTKDVEERCVPDSQSNHGDCVVSVKSSRLYP